MDAELCDLRLEAQEVGISADLAYALGRYRWTELSPAGERVEDGGTYLAVYRSQADGLWQAVANVFSRAQPAAPSAGSVPASAAFGLVSSVAKKKMKEGVEA